MKRYLFFILVLFLLNFNVFAFEIKTDEDKYIDQLIYDAVEDYHAGRFEESLEKFREIQKLRPKHPAGYVYEAGALNFIMSDFRNYKWAKEFNSLIKKSIILSKEMIKKNPKSPWGYFYLGASFGFRGVKAADDEKWIKAFIDGNLGYIQLKKVQDLDPTIIDIYYGLGIYHYWRGAKTKVFKWLKIFPGEKELGLSQLEKCIQEGNYTRVEGESSLLRILVYEERFPEAVELADSLISRYPGFLFCYRYRGIALVKQKKFKSAIDNQYEMMEIINNSKYAVKYTLFEVEKELFYIYIEMGDHKKAREYGTELTVKYKKYRTGRIGKELPKIKKTLKKL
ncbi:hypothetical protein KAU33_16765 [Candidatus Dependentiae bacterium]|nr:hypothetical protein [Candidatus Dependentiae bacterium]